MRVLIATVMLAGIGAPAGAQPTAPVTVPAVAQSSEHLRLADDLMETLQIRKAQLATIPMVLDAIMPMMIRGNENRASEVRTIVREEMNGMFLSRIDEIVRVTRDVYAKYLTDQELRDLIVFYNSATGRRLVNIQPAIIAESFAKGGDVGRKAAMDALPRILDRMRKANLKIPERP